MIYYDVKKHCVYYDGDEDTNKCSKRGYFYTCAGCTEYDDGSPKRPVEEPKKECYDKCSPSEMDKLEAYLAEHGFHYDRHTRTANPVQPDYDQIIVYEMRGGSRERVWDAICHRGSFGYNKDLLEIMGSIVDEVKDHDRVKGNLTAADIIKRIEGRR